MRRMLLLLIATGACAQAHKEGFTGRPDSGIHVVDSSGGGDDSNNTQSDAPNQQIDAPMQGGSQTLSQTTSNADDGISGIACGPTSGAYTLKNSYYRVFALSDYGITGVFHVQAVDFSASGVANSPPIKVSVGTYNGTTGGSTLSGTISLAANAMITPTDGGSTPHVPLTADISGNLVIEIDQTADGSTATPYKFYPGANTSGQTKPGYITAPGCSDANNNPITTPTDISQLAGSAVDIIMTVTGST